LYAMHEDEITSDKPYRKCANTVGSVLGRYHPHGSFLPLSFFFYYCIILH